MAAVVDNRFDNVAYPGGVGGMQSAPGMVNAQQTVITDSYGGWLTRRARALVFGLLGMAIVLGLFLPGLVMLGQNWTSDTNGGIRGSCTTGVTDRALTVCAFFIFHAMLVIPMFIRGDTSQTVTVANGYGNSLQSFWSTRVAHSAFILQIVGNLIELALLIWLAVAFWGHSTNTCSSNYRQFYNYTWALLIGGFAVATVSLLTSYWQYTSAAIRYRYGSGKNGGVLNSAP